MSKTNYAPSLSLLLAHEGGFVNNPKDPGGPTNKGVTQRVYDAYRTRKGLPIQSVRFISDTETADIYDAEYWHVIKGDELPAGIDYAMFDYAVNSGAAKAIKDVQRSINKNANFYGVPGQLKVDGVLGAATIGALQKAAVNGAEDFIEDYCSRRLAFMRSLKNWGTFGKGWTRRVEGAHNDAQDNDDGVVDLAVKMARNPVTVVQPGNIEAHAAAVAAGTAPASEVVVAPSAIGARAGEAPAKAFGSQVSVFKTVQGVGAALAAAGVTGNTLIDGAETAKTHVAGTLLGQLALVVFVLLMIGGVGLVLYKFFEDRREKGTK